MGVCPRTSPDVFRTYYTPFLQEKCRLQTFCKQNARPANATGMARILAFTLGIQLVVHTSARTRLLDHEALTLADELEKSTFSTSCGVFVTHS
jgi:hypothetical protein